jgi:uncharacterized repeat protein (TIGR03803 family)
MKNTLQFPRNFSRSVRTITLAVLVLSLAMCAQAQTYTVLHSFVGPEGVSPTFGIVRDSAGNLYGATAAGGIYGNCDNEVGGGAVYRIDPAGHATTLHAFNNGADGCFPNGGLVLDDAGTLYGVTLGSVYKIDPAGQLTTIFRFSFLRQAEGNTPGGTLFRDSGGNFYGTTGGGGNHGCQLQLGCGTVFELDASRHETALYAFQGGAAGFYPESGVIRDGAGNLYGATPDGSNVNCKNTCGVVFKIDPAGNETVLHAFTGGTDGRIPHTSGLARDAAGNLYGVTVTGGSGNCHYADGAVGCGTVFKITPDGTKSVLYSFQGGTDGISPSGTLALDASGNLYGTTAGGGEVQNDGIVFQIDSNGNETVLHRFNILDQGTNPSAGVILGADGNLYGTTTNGGQLGQGVVFKLVF